VIVNGIAYGTNHATVTANGRPGLVSDLRRGQVLTINGNIYGGSFSGAAHRIDYTARLVGPVEGLDGAANQLIVMGQTVISDIDTAFAGGIDPASYAGLSIGSNIEISGFARADGSVLATRIDPIEGQPDLRLTGEVADLDRANLQFAVNDLAVDYSAALVIDMPGGAPSNGETVQMTGELFDGRFVVETLASAPGLTGEFGRRVQTGGLVTRFYTSRDFYVNHFAIQTNSGTSFVFGDRGDLGLNIDVVIDGQIAVDGSIVADRVVFEW
jgi:hypothetical protein